MQRLLIKMCDLWYGRLRYMMYMVCKKSSSFSLTYLQGFYGFKGVFDDWILKMVDMVDFEFVYDSLQNSQNCSFLVGLQNLLLQRWKFWQTLKRFLFSLLFPMVNPKPAASKILCIIGKHISVSTKSTVF